jgi:hypothetical protein
VLFKPAVTAFGSGHGVSSQRESQTLIVRGAPGGGKILTTGTATRTILPEFCDFSEPTTPT